MLPIDDLTSIVTDAVYSVTGCGPRSVTAVRAVDSVTVRAALPRQVTVLQAVDILAASGVVDILFAAGEGVVLRGVLDGTDDVFVEAAAVSEVFDQEDGPRPRLPADGYRRAAAVRGMFASAGCLAVTA